MALLTQIARSSLFLQSPFARHARLLIDVDDESKTVLKTKKQVTDKQMINNEKELKFTFDSYDTLSTK